MMKVVRLLRDSGDDKKERNVFWALSTLTQLAHSSTTAPSALLSTIARQKQSAVAT